MSKTKVPAFAGKKKKKRILKGSAATPKGSKIRNDLERWKRTASKREKKKNGKLE